jgi:hypothetical protein
MKEMLTYESVWLENDQFLKVKEFIEKLGITNYTTQRIEEEGVSTITIPEISEEHWHLVEDFEYTLLRGDFEAETDPTALQQLQDNLANEIFGQTKAQAQDKNVCISCNQPIYIQWDSKAQGPGRVYSSAGEKEYSLSGLCEYCFDKVFDDAISPGEREIEELESFVENHQ